MKQLTDDSIFPFGKYFESRTKMRDVPSAYLDWIAGQPWIGKWPAVVDYIARSRKAIDQDLKREGRI